MAPGGSQSLQGLAEGEQGKGSAAEIALLCISSWVLGCAG